MRPRFQHGLLRMALLLVSTAALAACQAAPSPAPGTPASVASARAPAAYGAPPVPTATQPAAPATAPALPAASSAPVASTAPSPDAAVTAQAATPIPATQAAASPAPAATPAGAAAATPMSPTLAAAQATPAATAAISGTAASSSAGPDVLYHDDFTNTKSGWPDELVFQNYYVGYHEPDNYHVEVHVQNDNAVVDVPGKTFDNFQAETQVQTAKANTAPTGDFRYGLAFRQAGKRYYAFVISPRTKTWYVLKSSPGGVQVLSQGTQDSIQGLQALDTLRINAQGPVMTFFINNQAVSQVSDGEYTDGALGLYVETMDSPKAHIHFHNLTVRKPQEIVSSPGSSPACQVAVDLLRLRPEPAFSDQPAIAGLFRGTQLDPLGRSPDGAWVHVQIHGAAQAGWVNAQNGLVSCNVAVADLPVVQVSAAATPAAK